MFKILKKIFVLYVFFILSQCVLFGSTVIGSDDETGSNVTIIGKIVNSVNGQSGDIILSTETASNKVSKSGDTMTGSLIAPSFNAIYGISASTGVFTSTVTASFISADVSNNIPVTATTTTFNGNILVNTNGDIALISTKKGSTTGNNIFLGTGGQIITSANQNTTFGMNAGNALTSATDNSFFGYNAGLNNISGNLNSGMGQGALQNLTTSGNNSAFGFNSLYHLVNKGSNTALGSLSGKFLANGSTPNDSCQNSIYVGFNSKSGVASADNEAVYGYLAVGNGSNTVTIGNSNVIATYLKGNVLANDFTASYGVSSSTMSATTSVTTPRMNALDVNGLKLFDDGGNLGIYIKDGGAVAVGTNTFTATAAGTLTVGVGGGAITLTGAANTDTIYGDGNDSIIIGAASNGARLSMNAANVANFLSCKVGVDVASPVEQLEVAGTIKATQGISASTGVFTSTVTVSLISADLTNNISVTATTTTFNGNVLVNTDGDSAVISSRKSSGTGKNLFLGDNPAKLTSGNQNVSLGFNALNLITSGSSNLGVGYDALHGVTTGSNNVALGWESQPNLIAGNGNTSTGYSAMLSNTNSNNSAYGIASLRDNISGANNSAFGGQSAHYIHDGVTALTNVSNSTYLGYNTKASTQAVTNETAIGYLAVGSGSNTVTIGNTSVIGTYLKGTVYTTKNNTPITSTQILYSTNSISSASDNAVVVSSGGAVSLTTAQIIAGTVGDKIEVWGSSDINTITLVDGGVLKLNSDASFTLGLDDVITFRYMSSGYWCEISRSNN